MQLNNNLFAGSSTPTSTLTWISWFCSLPGHEYYCEVTEDFIEDDFNLTGLNSMVPFWKEAMEMVLDVEPDEETNKIPDVSIVEASAELLYGLVHQRYILTRMGLQAMVEKYEQGIFGACPRVFCNGTHVVPCGRTDIPGHDTVKLYCPNCSDIYTPPSSRFQGVDGAFFGTTFPHLFFQSYRELAPAPFWKPTSGHSSSPTSSRSVSPDAVAPDESAPAGQSKHVNPPPFVNPNPHGGQKRPAGRVYQPKIYGFRVSEQAKNGPRMLWMRLRPQDPEELDMVDWRGRFYDDEDDEYDHEDGAAEEDRPMEDFDPVSCALDGHDEDDDEEEEEEEEEARPPYPPQGRTRADFGPPSQSPPSSAPPRTPRDSPIVSASLTGKAATGRAEVKAVKQWGRVLTA
ncbi:casein kinase II regulatory subunit-domain-containing protein [Cytidiella melzeri]|nr:casein kinase II regulatory subunit-domain-containing protein [Cytidiella melzeri]